MPESLFNKDVGLRPATLLIKNLWHKCFPVNFVKFLRTRFLQNTLRTTAPLYLKKLELRTIQNDTTRKRTF